MKKNQFSKKALSNAELKKITGGKVAENFASCTKDCGNNTSVSCSGTSCSTYEVYGGGCYSLTNGTLDIRTYGGSATPN
jgi:natural product precursor